MVRRRYMVSDEKQGLVIYENITVKQDARK